MKIFFAIFLATLVGAANFCRADDAATPLHIQGHVQVITAKGLLLECVAVGPRSTGDSFTIYLKDYSKQAEVANGDFVDAVVYPAGLYTDAYGVRYHAFTTKAP